MTLIKAPCKIPDVCGALHWRFGKHDSCAVGVRLIDEAQKILDGVQGLDLGAL